MMGMFAWCNSLTSLDLSSFNTTNVTKMGINYSYDDMFKNIPSNIKIYLKDTETNRNFMNTNFSSYHPTYI